MLKACDINELRIEPRKPVEGIILGKEKLTIYLYSLVFFDFLGIKTRVCLKLTEKTTNERIRNDISSKSI